MMEGAQSASSLAKGKQEFEFFWKKDSYFSQFYSCKFQVGDITYNGAEQYMMHQKAVCFQDDEIAADILRSTSPREIKNLGRKVKNYDDDIWESKCYDIVKAGNMYKFSSNPELKRALFATKGKVLVEASPVDRKWGIGLAADNPLAWNIKTWEGRNLLGYALTEVRDELMRKEGLL